MDERPEQAEIRASDDERDQSVALLREAVVTGRLTLDEFSERVGQAQAARTAGELVALTRDLPAPPPPVSDAPVRHRALCSRLVRRGPWEMPARSSWHSLFGTIELDLRDATLTSSEVELDVRNVFGTVTVTVPAGVRVDVEGGGLFASQVIEPPPRSPSAQAPRLRIRTTGPGGTLRVRYRAAHDAIDLYG